MKALRRSIKGDKDKDKGRDRDSDGNRQNGAPAIQKLAVAIMPPKKVIRAKSRFLARTSLELSFDEGDFFHVIDREDDTDFYEACNPALPDARGYVPVALFQVLGRTGAESEPETNKNEYPQIPPPIDTPLGSGSGYAMAASSAAASINRPGIPVGAPISMPMTPGHRSSPSMSGPKVYGVVIYDFNAERADELEAKNGEAIIVIAQSNPEWFVAKPIGRLGGPGLIPVSYVQIRDMSTGQALDDPTEAIRQAGVPRVEEWKKMAADYKSSSITLGKFEGSASPSPYGDQQTQAMQQALERVSLQPNQNQQNGQRGSNSQQGYSQADQAGGHNRGPGGSVDYRNNQALTAGSANPTGAQVDQLSHATVACVYETCDADEPKTDGYGMETKYWFIIGAEFEDGQYWSLARYYEDFQDLQLRLLKSFPEEAGRKHEHRTLPYMPGPVENLTKAITEGRLVPLDRYVKRLLAQPARISQSVHVRRFFAPREGDARLQPNEFEDSYQTAVDNEKQQQRLDEEERKRVEQERKLQAQGSNAAESQIIIKVCYRGEFKKIQASSRIQLKELLAQIRKRYNLGQQSQLDLFYYDDQTKTQPSLISDDDVALAIERNAMKLMVYAELV